MKPSTIAGRIQPTVRRVASSTSTTVTMPATMSSVSGTAARRNSSSAVTTA